MRKIKRIMGILLTGMLLIGTFQLLPMDIDGAKTVCAAVMSSDNSLSTLSISPGTLSPAFQYNVVNYTATVGADVTSVEVNAKLSNETATIESVSGNTDLKAGENLISIVVKAQDGTPATYKIVVTREAGGEGTTQQPEDAAAQEPQAEEENAGGITIDEHPFNLAPTISDDLVPQDFTKTTVTCQGQQVEGLTFDKADLTLVYLTTPSADVKNTLAVYEEAGGFYPFRKIQFDEANYLIVLNPPAESGLTQEYTQTTQTVGEFSNVPVFVKGDASQGESTEQEEGAKQSDFSLVYGVSSHGNKGWYQYDAVESTFQRFVAAAAESEQDVPVILPEDESAEPGAEMQSLQNAYTDMENQYNSQKDLYRKTTAVMSFMIAVLLVVVVNLLLRGKKNEDAEWEEDDYDELSEKVREQVKSMRRSRRAGEDPEGDQSGLWEDDTVSKAILKQQTKIIPQLGEEIQESLEMQSEAGTDRKTKPGKKSDPEIGKISKSGKKSDPEIGKISKSKPGKISESDLEKILKAKPQKIQEPEQRVEPERDFDDDFEVIDLEDL